MNSQSGVELWIQLFLPAPTGEEHECATGAAATAVDVVIPGPPDVAQTIEFVSSKQNPRLAIYVSLPMIHPWRIRIHTAEYISQQAGRLV